MLSTLLAQLRDRPTPPTAEGLGYSLALAVSAPEYKAEAADQITSRLTTWLAGAESSWMNTPTTATNRMKIELDYIVADTNTCGINMFNSACTGARPTPATLGG